jgi:excinuclease UvrABC nuclease subunit
MRPSVHNIVARLVQFGCTASSRVQVPSPIRLAPQAPGFPDQLGSFRKKAGIYRLNVRDGAPHIGWSANLERRLKRLFVSATSSSQSALSRGRERMESVDCWLAGSRLETSLVMYELARLAFPDSYVKLLKLRIPWFVRLTASDPFPRLDVLNRVPARAALLFGQFASRGAAQQYEQELLGLFQIRRCTEALVPASIQAASRDRPFRSASGSEECDCPGES